jgi:hypothetical protein
MYCDRGKPPIGFIHIILQTSAKRRGRRCAERVDRREEKVEITDLQSQQLGQTPRGLVLEFVCILFS